MDHIKSLIINSYIKSFFEKKDTYNILEPITTLLKICLLIYKIFLSFVYYENQFEAHLGFPDDHYWLEVSGKRRTKTVIIRLEKAIEF